jgi:hypothetical protein
LRRSSVLGSKRHPVFARPVVWLLHNGYIEPILLRRLPCSYELENG